MEMIKAASDKAANLVCVLATTINRFIVCLYNGKGNALDRGNYRGLKLIEQAMKILERIVDGLIR